MPKKKRTPQQKKILNNPLVRGALAIRNVGKATASVVAPPVALALTAAEKAAGLTLAAKRKKLKNKINRINK